MLLTKYNPVVSISKFKPTSPLDLKKRIEQMSKYESDKFGCIEVDYHELREWHKDYPGGHYSIKIGRSIEKDNRPQYVKLTDSVFNALKGVAIPDEIFEMVAAIEVGSDIHIRQCFFNTQGIVYRGHQNLTEAILDLFPRTVIVKTAIKNNSGFWLEPGKKYEAFNWGKDRGELLVSDEKNIDFKVPVDHIDDFTITNFLTKED